MASAQEQAWFSALDAVAQKKVSVNQRADYESLQKKEEHADPMEAEPGYRWQEAAAKRGLNAEETDRLARDKLLIEDRQYKQSFSVYINDGGPFFLTSDSLLNAFHVLFEDSFRDWEIHRAPLLRRNLEVVLGQARVNLKRAEFAPADLAPGWRQAQLVVGPALLLVGSSPELFDADVRAEIQAQVVKIKAAEATELPVWLGPPSRTLLQIDYRRCKPVGFYASDPKLADYFRAVRWLQMIPFRADRDAELAAIAMLAYGLNQAQGSRLKTFFSDYRRLIGPPNADDLVDADYEFQNLFFDVRSETTWEAFLRDKRRWLLRTYLSDDERKHIDDTNRLPPRVGEILPEIQFRMLPSAVGPDDLLFQRLTEAQQAPSGLAVAAMLGSPFAHERLPQKSVEVLSAYLSDAERESSKEHRSRRMKSLYDDYLDALKSMLLPAPNDAPALFKGMSWQAKSCVTVLGGWVQMRHTFTLQKTAGENYLLLQIKPPGFVEPLPEFYSRMARLSEAAAPLVSVAAEQGASGRSIAAELKEDADFIEALQFHASTATPAMIKQLSRDQQSRHFNITYEYSGGRLTGWFGDRRFPRATTSPAEFQAYHAGLIAALRAEAERYEKGEKTPPIEETILRQRWLAFERICRQLESLSHKQLRGAAWTREESQFIKTYGEQLGFVMGYYGNAWLQPHDDAPRWAEVHRDPNLNTSLAVGIGRARLIHVLYPWKGQEILCIGAIMPYYEYEARNRLTDSEWQQLLDSPQAPPIPEWIAPYVAR